MLEATVGIEPTNEGFADGPITITNKQRQHQTAIESASYTRLRFGLVLPLVACCRARVSRECPTEDPLGPFSTPKTEFDSGGTPQGGETSGRWFLRHSSLPWAKDRMGQSSRAGTRWASSEVQDISCVPAPWSLVGAEPIGPTDPASAFVHNLGMRRNISRAFLLS